MKKIYKWAITSGKPIRMFEDAQILALQTQNEVPCLWALVDTDKPTVERVFDIYGTGWKIEEPVGKYIGTFQQNGGVFVFHVFEKELNVK